MYDQNKIRFFRKVLLNWFESNRREFPWRKSNISNYQIIITEILLQRTKAESVAAYFDVFFEKYPSWNELTMATIPDLEEMLRPLGLQRHRANRIFNIAQEYKHKNGSLPKNKNELSDTNLATQYISGAYELFILNHRAALLDVNMSRLLRRFFHPKEFQDVRNDKIVIDLANNVINVKSCKELNWSILDFAAMVCKSQNPNCSDCILNSKCEYYYQLKPIDDIIDETQLKISYNSTVVDDPNKPLKVISLFSGCGGMDIGFEGGFLVHRDSVNEKNNPTFITSQKDDKYVNLRSTKFQTVLANDILPEARNAWVNYFKQKGYSSEIYHVASIVDLVKAHKLGARIFPDSIDVVTGGFPCQDFSLAGKRNGFSSHKDHNGNIIKSEVASIETRGQLYMWLKEVVEITKPKIFIAENVKGLVNLSNVKEIIQKDFSSANGNGYIVLNPLVLHAADYGVPQSRERVFFIGIKKEALNQKALLELSKSKISDKYNPFPKPTHAFTHFDKTLKSPVLLNTIFKDLPEPEKSLDPSQIYYSKAKFMGKHCQGQTEINLNGIGPTIRSEHHGNIEFRRLSLKNGGKIYQEIVDKKLIERRLTPRECALIQTFPPDYELVIPNSKGKFLISPSIAYKLIGNAVPPLLAFHVANRIESLWNLYFNKSKNGSISKSNTRKEIIRITSE
jgi:DNA (cytosine-5)-methyltransferase 1